MTPSRPVFSPLVLGLVAAAVTGIFALSVLLSMRASSVEPYAAEVASRSALGHAGVFEMLRRLDLPVARSRLDGRQVPGPGGVLVIAEPDLQFIANTLDFGSARAILLVLPKWQGLEDDARPGTLRAVGRLPLSTVHGVLELVAARATVARFDLPARWPVNSLGLAPQVEGQVQLIRDATLRPLIGDADGMLLGETIAQGRRIWILADPDPLENHGLAKPGNAKFAVAVLQALRRGSGLIVFDETVHGMRSPVRNPLQLLFRFPYVIVTLQILIALGLLLLATMSRFGGNEPDPRPFDRGKRLLIGNMAAQLDRAGHQAFVLRRYLSMRVADAGVALHAPPGLDEQALAGWLDRHGRARGMTVTSASILARGLASNRRDAAALATLFAAARDIHLWNEDLLNGPGTRQDRR